MNGFIDIHCHILPGVDDGASGIDATREMLAAAYGSGTRMIVATPHFVPGQHNPPPAFLASALEQTRELANEIASDFRIELANELYMVPGALRLLQEKRVQTYDSRNLVLAEFDPGVDFTAMTEQLNQARYAGYRMILAHTERYRCLNEDRLQKLAECGVHMQMNAKTVTSVSFFARTTLKRLLRSELIDFIASDGHDPKHRPAVLQEAYTIVCDWCGKETAAGLFWHNYLNMITD